MALFGLRTVWFTKIMTYRVKTLTSWERYQLLEVMNLLSNKCRVRVDITELTQVLLTDQNLTRKIFAIKIKDTPSISSVTGLCIRRGILYCASSHPYEQTD